MKRWKTVQGLSLIQLMVFLAVLGIVVSALARYLLD